MIPKKLPSNLDIVVFVHVLITNCHVAVCSCVDDESVSRPEGHVDSVLRYMYML